MRQTALRLITLNPQFMLFLIVFSSVAVGFGIGYLLFYLLRRKHDIRFADKMTSGMISEKDSQIYVLQQEILTLKAKNGQLDGFRRAIISLSHNMGEKF